MLSSDAHPVGIGGFEIRPWGFEAVRDRLASLIARGRLAQVVLLAGPPGIGKASLALWVAQAVLCPHQVDGRPCGSCRGCRLVAELGHPDLSVADSPLRIEASRDLQRQLALTPGESARRVAILADIDAASAGAANSLLKLLEEPPPHLCLLLTAGDPAAVLATIRSRSQQITLTSPGDDAVRAALQHAGCSDDVVAALTTLAAGRTSWALQNAATPDRVLETERHWLAVAEQLAASVTFERLAAVSGRLDADAAGETLASWRRWWRARLDDSVAGPNAVAPGAAPANSRHPDAGARAALAMLKVLDLAARQIEAKTQPNLVLETVVLAWPRLAPAER